MGDNQYRISEAAKLLQVEDHVLRYWEEDLGMDIPRNELGHRYYTDIHIDTFRRVMEMKEKGMKLQEIRQALLAEGNEALLKESQDEVAMTDVRELPSERAEQFQNLMVQVVAQAIETNNEQLTTQVSDRVSERVLKEMNYLARTREEREEERYRKLDEVLRTMQRERKQAAESADRLREAEKDRKRSLFGKNTGKNRKEAKRKPSFWTI